MRRRIVDGGLLVTGVLGVLTCLIFARKDPPEAAEYAAVFHPPSQPEEWRQERFFSGSGVASPSAVSCYDPRVLPAFWGTRGAGANSEAAEVGVIVTPFLTVDPGFLLVPFLGNLPDTTVVLESEQGARKSSVHTSRVGRDLEMPRFLWFDFADAEAGVRWRLVATDDEPTGDRWLAVASPVPCPDEAAAQEIVRRWRGIYRNDGEYFLSALGIGAALIGIPLLVATCTRQWVQGFWVTVLFNTVGWAGVGLLWWLGMDAVAEPLAKIAWWGGCLGGLAGLVRWRWLERTPRRLIGAFTALYVLALAMAHLQTVPDVPVLGEYNQGTVLRGRMIASPSDNLIPFCTAIYLYHQKDGKTDREAYFGTEWSIGSRGPLLPLVITALFVARDDRPHDPPFPAPRRWPLDDEGFHVARSAGITLNALMALAIASVAGALGVTRPAAAAVTAGALTVVSPFFVSNVVFAWPKLLAAAAAVLAVAAIRDRRNSGWWPLVLTFGYYAHPVAALFFPALLLIEGWGTQPNLNGWVKLAVIRGAIFSALLLPWILYKVWLGHPDVFFKYMLGDGRGPEPALSISSWLECRWQNIWRTFVPLAEWWDLRPFAYFTDHISGAALWSVYTSRSLFGGLGVATSLVLLVSARKIWRQHRREVLAVAAASLTLVIYWGYAPIGLGRQCIEAVTALTLALVAAAPAIGRRWQLWWVALTGVELLFILGVSINWSGIEAPRFLLVDEWPYAAALMVAALAPAGIAARTFEEPTPTVSPDVQSRDGRSP